MADTEVPALIVGAGLTASMTLAAPTSAHQPG